MAVYRQIQVGYWQDPFVLDLTPEEKYFYIYLMTNSKTKQCGIYELPKKVMELETGYNRETVEKLIKRFVEYEKLLYDEETKELMLTNWLKHNPVNSEPVRKCVEKELSSVKSTKLVRKIIPLIGGLGGAYIPLGEEKEKEEEQKEEKEKLTPEQVINLFHSICKSLPKVKILNDKRKKTIKARFKKYPNIETYQELFTKAEESNFLSGRNGEWSANFDWLLNETNMIKVLEGNYVNKIPKAKDNYSVNKSNTTDYDALLRRPDKKREFESEVMY